MSRGSSRLYAPIGVEQTAAGYEVAWKNSGTNQYSIWNTDSNGNFTSYSVYSGTSTTLESLESSFHQDLNGDGVIGIPAGQTPSGVLSHATPVEAASNDTFAFRPDLGSGIATNAQGAETIEFGRFSSVSGNHLAAPFNDAQISQSPLPFVNVGLDSLPDPVNHDSMVWTSVHIADLHANDFSIR